MTINVGDKVRIHGDQSDFTDHLDGKTGVVLSVRERDCVVKVGNSPYPWSIWKYNLTHV